MSEEEAQKDFVGFARDIQQLRYTLRSALGLSPMRPLERMRMNTQTLTGRLGESMQIRQEQQQKPQQDQECQGQGAATPFRPFGILDRFLQPLQSQQAEEPLTPEEAEKLKEIREDELRRIEAERKQRAVDRVKADTHFSVEL
jgi:hypothetical protein